MRKHRFMLICFFVVVAIIISIFSYAVSFPLTLIVEAEANVLLSVPTHEKDFFHLVFVHSVHRTQVMEYFQVKGVHSLELVATEYESYGVGMPSLPSEGVFEQRGKRFRLSQINRHFSAIPLRVGPEAQLTIVHGGMEYPVYKWVPAGSALQVRVEYSKLWKIYRHFIN